MKRAYVGMSVPVGWDYIREPTAGLPNPVIENVLGLLICYDELWFPSVEFCPEDMRDLPYVHFVDRDVQATAKAEVAIAQVRESGELKEVVNSVHAAVDRDAYVALTDAYRRGAPFDIALDSHSRGTSQLGMGNSSTAAGWAEDVVVAAALDLDLDVVVNTTVSNAINRSQVQGGGEALAYQVTFAENVIRLRTTDYLTETAAYHPSLEDLRSQASVAEFRAFVSEAKLIDQDLDSLAREVERKALEHNLKVMERFVKGPHKVESIGGPALGAAGNLLQPGAGSLLRCAIAGNRWLRDRSLKRELPWALFRAQAQLWVDGHPPPRRRQPQ